MPFSFPTSNLTVGQTSTQNGRQYAYAGNNVWELVAAGVVAARAGQAAMRWVIGRAIVNAFG
jgi:hypothetical protein